MSVSKQAKELAAKLISHTTSVHNVTLIAEALDAARNDGWDDAIDMFAKNADPIGQHEISSLKSPPMRTISLADANE